MPVPQISSPRCEQRNRRAAHLGETAIPVRLQPDPPDSIQANRIKAIGTIPEGDAAVRQINQMMRLEGDSALKPDQVYLLHPEVANSNYISDRSMFIHSSTLKNIQRYAADGFAFMNSHRTGTASTDAELPFGRTYAGRYEVWEAQDGSRFGRTLLGAYMLRGQHPNGAAGPSTDDLYAGIRAGTIFDISVGLREGEYVCDVCGEDLVATDEETGRWLCPHVPGTTRKMTDEEIAAQEERGVPDGVATFSLVDAYPGEFSAVYDGALPGAGFRKAVALVRAAGQGRVRFRSGELEQLGQLYRPFFSAGTRRMYARLAGGRAGLVSVSGGSPMPFFNRGRGRARLSDTQGRPVGQVEFLEDDGSDDDGYDRPPVRRPAPPDNAGSGFRGGGSSAESLNTEPDPAVVKLQEQVERLTKLVEQGNKTQERLLAERTEDQRARLRKESETFARNLFRPADGSDPRRFGQKVIPAQLKSVADLHFNAAWDDLQSPRAEGEPTRLAAVQEWAKHLQTRDLLGEMTLPDETPGAPLANDPGGPDEGGPLSLKSAEERARKFAARQNGVPESNGHAGRAADLN